MTSKHETYKIDMKVISINGYKGSFNRYVTVETREGFNGKSVTNRSEYFRGRMWAGIVRHVTENRYNVSKYLRQNK